MRTDVPASPARRADAEPPCERTIPAHAVYVFAGSLSGSLAAATADGRARTPAEWALLLGGLGATVVLTLYLRRLAARELGRSIPEA